MRAEPEHVLFDDFHYQSPDDPQFSKNGWIARTASGWPGIQGAVWAKEQLTFIDDPDQPGNRLMQLNASTNNTEIRHAQICRSRKFFEGTYASRVRFSDKPLQGIGGDQLVQSFYMISPYVKDMDPDYSEIDFEYLPYGGWGAASSTFHQTTWYTAQLSPQYFDNANTRQEHSMEGWHTLIVQVADGHVKYYVNGNLVADHTGKYFPRVPMSINYNVWFIENGAIQSSEMRRYASQVDWTYFTTNTTLSFAGVTDQVAALRKAEVRFVDSVPEHNPPLYSPCNL